MAQAHITILKYRDESIVRKCLTKARPKNRWANVKLHINMINVKTLFRCPTAFSFVDSNTPLSLGLAPLPDNSFPLRCHVTLPSKTVLGSLK